MGLYYHVFINNLFVTIKLFIYLKIKGIVVISIICVKGGIASKFADIKNVKYSKNKIN